MILLGDKIKALRKGAHYTQKELAERLNVTKTSVSAYERNIRQPSIDVIISIARVFNISTDYLLLDRQHKVVEITGLDDTQEKIIRENINMYKTANRLMAYIEKKKLKNDFINSDKL